MGAHKVFDSFPHNFDIETILGKEVFVRPLGAPIPGIEIITNFLTGQYPDILWEYRIKHRTILYVLVRVVILELLRVDGSV